jgi:hypothetical protein
MAASFILNKTTAINNIEVPVKKCSAQFPSVYSRLKCISELRYHFRNPGAPFSS